MNYLRNKKRNKKGVYVLSAIVLGIVLVILVSVQPPVWMQKGISVLVEPVLRAKIVFERIAFFETLKAKEALVRENRELRRELTEAQLELFDRRVLRKENTELQALLGRSDEQAFLLASTLTRPSMTPYDTLIIDVGEKHNVQAGDGVFVSNAVVVGEIDEVYDSTSRVRLYSSPGVETGVILSSSDTTVLATGTGGGNFVIGVPEGVSTTLGEEVILPGLHPRVLGVISRIEDVPAETFKNIYFRTPINISTIQRVLVDIGE